MSGFRNTGGTAFLTFAAGISTFAFAQVSTGLIYDATITGVRVDSENVAVSVPVGIQVDFNTKEVPKPWCGFEISWGDGDRKTIRAGHDGADNFPLRFSHSYLAPGQFMLRVSGKDVTRGLRSASACAGESKQVTVTVVDAAENKAKVESLKEQDEIERKARELALKETELRKMADRLERERKAQERKEQEFQASQRAAETKEKQAQGKSAAPNPQVAPSGKPTIDPF